MIPRFGEAIQTGQRYHPRPGVYAILALGGKVLVTHQDRPKPEFQLPGGGIDPGEAPLPALHREVYEETGWSIGAPRRLGAFRRFAYMPEYDKWAEKICTIYAARPIRRLGPPPEPHHTATWLDLSVAIRELGNGGDRYFLGRFAMDRTIGGLT